MAIKKELIGRNGEKREYFKISKVILDYEKNSFKVECASYANEGYREKEKEIVEDFKKNQAILDYIANKLDRTEEELALWAELNAKNNSIYLENESLKIKNETFEIELENDLLETFYKALKKNPVFNDAIDAFSEEPTKKTPTQEELQEKVKEKIKQWKEKVKK